MNLRQFAEKEFAGKEITKTVLRRAQALCISGLIVGARKQIVNDRYVWVIDDDYIRLPGKRGPKGREK